MFDNSRVSVNRTSKRNLSDALAYFEAFVWITFGVIGPLIWMYRLFEAERYLILASVAIAWILSLVVYGWYLFTRSWAIFAVALIIVWCIGIVMVLW